MTFAIRTARPEDAATIAAFNAALAAETEGRVLDPARLAAGVAALLADSSKGIYFVADHAGSVIGQTLITYEWSDWRNGTFWWIQSVYVHPDWRRRGVFRALYRHIHALAERDPTVCGLRLYVEDHNRRAQQTYLALGMRDAGYRVLEDDFTGLPQASPIDFSA